MLISLSIVGPDSVVLKLLDSFMLKTAIISLYCWYISLFSSDYTGSTYVAFNIKSRSSFTLSLAIIASHKLVHHLAPDKNC